MHVTAPPERPARRLALRQGARLGLAGAAALALPAAPARAAEPGVAAGEVLIGQNITLQAGKAAFGNEVQSGVLACLDEVNRGGGVNGRRIVLRTLDDDGKADAAEAHARTLIDAGVFMLFGSLEGGPSTAVMKAAVERRVPFFGPMAGSPGLRRPNQPLVFPVRAEHREEFRELIGHGRRIGLRRVMLMHADSGVGREHLANVERLAGEAGMAFGGGLPFKSDITDEQLDALVRETGARNVDLVINHGSAGIYERLIRRAKQAGSRANFWGVNSGSTPLAAALGPLAHGMVFTQIVPNPNSGKTSLVREYQQRYAKAQPGKPFGYGSLEGYMTAKALVAALRAAGPNLTRDGLLRALSNFDTDLGGVSLRYRPGDHQGSTFVDLALVGRDGRFVQ